MKVSWIRAGLCIAAIALAALWWKARLASERELAVRSMRIEALQKSADSLVLVGDSLRIKYKRDTVRIVRSVFTVDTLVQSRIDTAIVHQTDTVKITVREAVAIQDTIRACLSIVRTCGERADAAELRATKSDSALKLALKPRSFTDRLTYDALRVGLGFLLGVVTSR